MNSQIYESAEVQEDIVKILADADQRIDELERQRAAIAERRRSLVEPMYKTVVANPTELHHKITLGGVLVNQGLTAADADSLAGLLTLTAREFGERFTRASVERPDERAGAVVIALLDCAQRELTARGLFEEWERRLAFYAEDRSQWLARDEEFRLGGAWREAAMTPGQRWLIRVTCRILRIDMPGHLLRGEAADWLENNGANLNYGDFV